MDNSMSAAEPEAASPEDSVPLSHETLEELVKMYTALTMEDIQDLNELGITDYANANKKKKKKKEEAVNQWIVPDHRQDEARREINLVLLGKTGSGKSSTGNLILGEKHFLESDSSQSCTLHVDMRQCEFEGAKVNVIDVPGFQDTNQTPEDILTEMAKVVDQYKDGIDGILYVFSLGDPRFTDDQQTVFEAMQKGFGDGVIDNCFAILTHIETKKSITSLSSYLERENKSIYGDLLNNKLQRRVIGVNNAEETIYGREIQRQNIIRLIFAKAEKRFHSDKFRKYQEGQKEIVGKFPNLPRDVVPSLQREMAAALRPMSHQDIKDLQLENSTERAQLVDTVTRKVMKNKGMPQERYGDVWNAAGVVLNAMITRLTGKEFLEHLGWAVAIFGVAAAGVAGGVAAIIAGVTVESLLLGSVLIIGGATVTAVAASVFVPVVALAGAVAVVAHYKSKK